MEPGSKPKKSAQLLAACRQVFVGRWPRANACAETSTVSQFRISQDEYLKLKAFVYRMGGNGAAGDAEFKAA